MLLTPPLQTPMLQTSLLQTPMLQTPLLQTPILHATVPLSAYLILAAILFSIGIAAFLIKRNIVSIFMSIELMLNAVNLTFVAFAHRWQAVSPLAVQGQIFVFFVMVVAAAEAAVGLAIIIAIFRTRKTLNVDQINLLNN